MVWGIAGHITSLSEGKMGILRHHSFGLVESVVTRAQMIMSQIGIAGIGGYAAGVQVGFGQGGVAEGHKEPMKAANGPIRRGVPVLGQYGIARVPTPVRGVVADGFQTPLAQAVVVVLHYRRLTGEVTGNPLQFIAEAIGIGSRVALPANRSTP